MQAEVLIDKHSHRALGILRAMVDAAPAADVQARETQAHQGRSPLLVMWGAGRSDHRAMWQQTLARGGHCVGFDLGYWGREKSVGCVRVHIDSRHPSQEQLARVHPRARLGQKFALREDALPDGPVLIVGLGNKSRHMRGEQPEQWERQKFAELRREFPGRSVEWRPKYRLAPFRAPLPLAPDLPIEAALQGRSLVVCAHSNVALDACLAGVPVRCEDGVAHVLYSKGENPSPEQRLDLLNRATWWNWHPSEAKQLWDFIRCMISN